MEYGMIIRLGFHRGSHGWYRRGGVSGILVVVVVIIVITTIPIVIVITMIMTIMTMTMTTTIIEWL